MSFENKKPSFKEKLETKKLLKYVLATMIGVGAMGGVLYTVLGSDDEVEQKNDIDYSGKLRYDKGSSANDDKIKSLVGSKASSSDPYASIVDPTLSNVISGQPNNTDNQSNINFGTNSRPLFSTDDKYAYKDNFDYDHATNSQLRAKIEEEEGKKLVKIATITSYVPDPDWRQNTNNQSNNVISPQQNNSGVKNSFPLLYDANGKQILGYDENGNPIIGYDANGKPILGNPLGKGIAGYDNKQNQISKNDLAKNLATQSNKQNIYDKNGRLILGYDKNGNPIIGYDANGKPILGITGPNIDGYDSNGNPIQNLKNGLYSKSGLNLIDKNGKPILGYDSNGNPIIGYDSNGKPILGKVDKGISGYDANGHAISDNLLNTIATQKNLLSNLNKPLLDKDGNPIVGFDASGNPIIGYDKNGKPILGKVDSGIAGYDANGNPIKKDQLQSYFKNNASDNLLQKSNKPLLVDKNGNPILGYDSKGNPIIGYDSNGKPILGKVDKGIAGYDVNGNPIKKDQLQDFYNGSSASNNDFSAINGVAGAGMFGQNNDAVPPVSGYQPGNKTVAINPQATGINVGNIKTQRLQQKESNPWDEAVSKTNVDADKATLSVSLTYKDTESKPQSANNVSQTNVADNTNSNNTGSNNVVDTQKAQNPTPTVMLPTAVYNKYTLKSGTFIPMIMQTGINTDLPGAIIGKVSQNVYDTATGKYLIIPQGSTLIGSYSANVTYGQERVMIAWNSLIYPDSSEIKITGQPGTDLGGYSGLNDQVNNHYWSLFGNTFLLSVLTAGLEYNQQGSANSMNNGSSFSSSLSNSSGQMMGQAAAGVIQKSLNIAPTLVIRNGMRGNVILTQDLALPSPYKVKIYNQSNY